MIQINVEEMKSLLKKIHEELDGYYGLSSTIKELEGHLEDNELVKAYQSCQKIKEAKSKGSENNKKLIQMLVSAGCVID